ncbi:ankyrin repeat domain-containing protein [Nocardia sp. 348MFTsu5.1]|uniref:ankyrin repeat domain-containing protein n=1 Tax=Nocardia sp. 348MFTsu5.1 TaxID=1172185 RepID=UPI00037A7598|nr:ankyrin repeat domain-containing protein [Nocardia sp. 348MFTsu5.1]
MEAHAHGDPADPKNPDNTEPSADVAELAGRMFAMARSGDLAMLEYIDAGVPVNLTNQAGDTVLMLAAYHGNSALVKGLLERGAEVDRANDKNQTPLAGAVFKSHDDVVRALIDAGADPDAGTPTARDAAHMFGREDYLGLLGK